MSSTTSQGAKVVPVSDPRPHPENHRSHHPKPGSKSFVNPWPSWNGLAPPLQFAKARLRGDITAKAIPEDVQARVNWQKTTFEYAAETSGKIKVAWLGHASMFLEFPGPAGGSRGLRGLCDPVFSQRCSPSQWMGPRRYTAPSTTVAELPEIDLVVISHNHYDHLDVGTITALNQRFPALHFFVSLGVKKWFLGCGIPGERVTEMDWWDEVLYSRRIPGQAGEQSLRIGYLPAQHFSNRGLNDLATTLWGSYSFETVPTATDVSQEVVKKVWFGGDTARRTISQDLERRLETEDPSVRSMAETELSELPSCPAHRQIGEYRGPFDLAIIPIGAYAPRYLMSPVHVDPGEAIEIFEEVRADRAVAIHWGTFSLSAEDVLEPRDLLASLCRDRNVTGFECWDMGKVMYI
ncbi:putative Zn-dependent hydrolase/oxidoreductase family protein [Taphrina deformans PYCC 5710]|uniref:Zn-dependent hydrolase/oxidoreductase family protein n=1 Tax=Taphrina deformans (strain PYCC 5710 / ATCC 11124 / CBS 356.35 / IMI 108563 / JCM 9778 / NBRC 8474) TaxID=1097556 RepID=R4XA01_TAPDE|nr:putative Zn-dependent hydrolase/oxidoreductase family protein [Taphrina deformans PYCC 5710]|eukprot:CCG81084.1 putative Zn-dependent hydrolase/oxidoreductase family protein [Taphrina deformans PYCC 5710]